MSKAYFARDALSNSGIKEILKSPAHFRHWTDNPKDDTSALRIGRAVHSFILEPDKEDTIVTFGETKTFNSKAGEAFLELYGSTHICLTQDERQTVGKIVEALKREVKIIGLIDACRREVEIYGQEPTTHGMIDTKAMLDAVSQTAIFDLKTTDEPAIDFPWTARKYQYDIQAAWYVDRAFMQDGLRRDFYFIVCEKKSPYGVLMYQAGEPFLASGRAKVEKAVEIYGRCKALKLWPSYDTNAILTLN